MKALSVIALLFSLWPALAGEPADGDPKEPALRTPPAPRAWLGLNVTKPEESIAVHLPALPPGIGFVVQSVAKDGPAEAAGLREFDVLWKLGDQMLVNESQLAVLLRLFKPGDEVLLTGFRAGKPLEVKLILGEAPERRHPVPGDLLDAAILPGECRGPMRVVNLAEKTATYSTEDGKLEVRKEGEDYQVKILDPKNQVIFDGSIPSDGSLDAIPDGWRRRVHALRRGLDHSLQGSGQPTRQPRPRVVPPAGNAKDGAS